MKRCRTLLLFIALDVAAAPAAAGVFDFFKRAPKPDPAERVSTLLMTVKGDADEDKREDAVEELREFDGAAHPGIVPALADVVLSDKSVSVRLEAVKTLGRLRPVSQQAGWALEQAQANDASLRVRLQARSTLWSYHRSGYQKGKPEGPSLAAQEAANQPPRLRPSAEPARRPTATAKAKASPKAVPAPVQSPEPPLLPPLPSASTP